MSLKFNSVRKEFPQIVEVPAPSVEFDETFSPEILITCPVTDRAVSTGLKTEWVVFESLPPVAVPMRCHACGRVHHWKPANAWVDQPPMLRRRRLTS